jgi:murein DD-endopeptidase MepM/ murein hydrolase activator NlpD
MRVFCHFALPVFAQQERKGVAHSDEFASHGHLLRRRALLGDRFRPGDIVRPHQRPRVGRRRDEGLRRIRSDVTPSYPSVDLATAEPATDASDLDDAPRLAPALDTGIAVQTRAGRHKAKAERRQRIAMTSAVAAVVVLVVAAIGWRYVSDRMAASTPIVAAATSAAPSSAAKVSDAVSGVSGAGSVRVASVSAVTNVASTTPVFAYYKTLKLNLPVAVKSLTEIGFHQASYPYALHIKTWMKNANLNLAAKNRSTGRDRAAQPSGPSAVLTGLVIRMWRSRPGRPDTAVDVGALAGTTVLAPVTGTIVKIKPYLLYGKYPDFEVHVHPDGTSGLDVVMIHLTSLTCSVGEHLDGGLTPIAKVRKLSDKFHDQLADYTKSPGDHVHIQINDANYPTYKGLAGAITPGATSTAGGSAGSTDETGGSDYSQGD